MFVACQHAVNKFRVYCQIVKIKTLREATECNRKNEPAVLDEQSHKNLELHVFTSNKIINSLFGKEK